MASHQYLVFRAKDKQGKVFCCAVRNPEFEPMYVMGENRDLERLASEIASLCLHHARIQGESTTVLFGPVPPLFIWTRPVAPPWEVTFRNPELLHGYALNEAEQEAFADMFSLMYRSLEEEVSCF